MSRKKVKVGTNIENPAGGKVERERKKGMGGIEQEKLKRNGWIAN